MVSSKKPKEKKARSDAVVNKAGGRNTRSSGSKARKATNKVNIVKKVPEIHEISESSSSDSVEEAIRGDAAKKSNGVVSKGRNGKSGGVPTKTSKNREEDDGGVEDAKMFKFPMNRIRRIMRIDNSAPQIMQDAVFLVNKATVPIDCIDIDIAWGTWFHISFDEFGSINC